MKQLKTKVILMNPSTLVLILAMNQQVQQQDLSFSTTITWSTPPATSSVPLTTTPIMCDDGWVDGHSVGMGCLLFKKTLKSHPEAKTFCQGQGRTSALVEVYSPDQLNFLRGKLSVLGSDWWGGATDERREGSWHWPRSGAGVVQGVWARGYPSRDSNQNFFCFS